MLEATQQLACLFLIGWSSRGRVWPGGRQVTCVECEVRLFWPPVSPWPGQSDHRAESSPGRGGEEVDGVAAHRGIPDYSGQDRHTGTDLPPLPVTMVTAGVFPVSLNKDYWIRVLHNAAFYKLIVFWVFPSTTAKVNTKHFLNTHTDTDTHTTHSLTHTHTRTHTSCCPLVVKGRITRGSHEDSLSLKVLQKNIY